MEIDDEEVTMEKPLRDELHPYKHGEIVWVKMGPCFWPGEVMDYDTLPEDIQNSKQKVPLVTVKFFGEESYEFVKTLDKIYSYNCTKKDEFIKKGLNLYRAKNRFMDKFPSDVIIAERKIGGDENIIDDPKFAPEEKEKPIKSTTKKKGKGRGRSSLNTSISGARKTPVTMQNVTHRRFVGDSSDFKVRYLIQKSSEPPEPKKVYRCFVCDFNTTNLQAMVYHHLNRKNKPCVPPKSKSKRKYNSNVKSKTPVKPRKSAFEFSSSSDSSSDHGNSESVSDDNENEDDVEMATNRISSNETSFMDGISPSKNNTSTPFSSSTRLEILNDWDDDGLDTKESTDELTLISEKTSEETSKSDTTVNNLSDLKFKISSSDDTTDNEELMFNNIKLNEEKETENVPMVASVIEKTIGKGDQDIKTLEKNVDVLFEKNANTIDKDVENTNQSEVTDKGEELINDITEINTKTDDILNKIDNVINKSIETTSKFEQDHDAHTEKCKPPPKIIVAKELDYFDFHEDEDDTASNDENLSDIVTNDSETTNSTGLQDFNKLLDSTTMSKLPEIPDSLKYEQNFHRDDTIKFPDKSNDEKNDSTPKESEKSEVATKLTNPKKRFVKSFEDFEQSLKIERERVEMSKKARSDKTKSKTKEFNITDASIKEVFEKTKHKIIKSFEDFEQSLKQAEAKKKEESDKKDSIVKDIDTNALSEVHKEVKTMPPSTVFACTRVLDDSSSNNKADKSVKGESKEVSISSTEEFPEEIVLPKDNILNKSEHIATKTSLKTTKSEENLVDNSEDVKKQKVFKKNECITPKSDPPKKLIEINLFDKEDKSKLKTKMEEKKKDPKSSNKQTIKVQVKKDSSGKHILKVDKVSKKIEQNKLKLSKDKESTSESNICDDNKLLDEKLKIGKDDTLKMAVETITISEDSVENKLNEEEKSSDANKSNTEPVHNLKDKIKLNNEPKKSKEAFIVNKDDSNIQLTKDELPKKIEKDQSKPTSEEDIKHLNCNKEAEKSKLHKEEGESVLKEENRAKSKDDLKQLKTDFKLVSKGGKEIILTLKDDLKRLSKEEAETKLKFGKGIILADEKDNTKPNLISKQGKIINTQKLLIPQKILPEKSSDKTLALESPLRISKQKRKSTDTSTDDKKPTVIKSIDFKMQLPTASDKLIYKKPKLDVQSESVPTLQVSKLKNQLMNKLNEPRRKSLTVTTNTSLSSKNKTQSIKYPRRLSLSTQEVSINKASDKVEVTVHKGNLLKNKTNEESVKNNEQSLPSSSCIVEDMDIETNLKETDLQETPQVIKIITPEFNDNSALNTLATVSEMSSLDLIQGEKEVNIDKNITVVTESDLTDKQVEIAKVPILEEGTIKSTTILSFSVDFTGDLSAPNVNLDLKNIDKPIKPKLKPVINSDLKSVESKTTKSSNINSVEMEMAKLTHTSLEQVETAQPQEATTSKKLLEILSENKPQLEVANVKSSPQVIEELTQEPSKKLKKLEVSISGQEVKPKIIDTSTVKMLTATELPDNKLKTMNIQEASIINKNKPAPKLKTYEPAQRLISTDSKGVRTQVLKIQDSSEKSQMKFKKLPSTLSKSEVGETPKKKIYTPTTNPNQILNDKVRILNNNSDVSVQKISLDKQNSYEDIDTFIIQKHQKRTYSDKPAESPPTKILKKALNKPLQTTHSVIKTNKGEDNVFDIDSMPIVLEDQIITSGKIGTVPVIRHVIHENKNPKSQVKKNPPGQMKILNKAGSAVMINSQLKPASGQKTYMKRVISSSAPKLQETNSPVLGSANKYVIVSSDSNKREVTKKTSTIPSLGTNKTQSIVQEPSGNKIMIVTNNQGQQSRVLLTPAQQKMMGYQTAKKSVIKSSPIQKDSLKRTPFKSTAMKPKTIVSSSSSNLLQVKKCQKFESKNKLIGQKVILNSQLQPQGQQRTILIKNSQGQTVKKIQGTDDALLEQQVAEQIEAINRASNAKMQIQYKPTQKREVIKKLEPAKVQNKPQLFNSASSSKTNVPPLSPISPSKKIDIKQNVQKLTKIVNTPIVGQGTQPGINEGQILALPCETLDGQPQSYMLVKLDETGNFTPLNNEALLSLDPNLNLGGDLSNMVLQIDQNEGIKDATAPKEELIDTVLPKLAEPPQVEDSSKVIEETNPEPVMENSDPIQAIACTINNGETNQQLIITGDPVSTQKFIDSLNEANSDLTNILSGAQGNILIHIDGQQILINTDTDNQTLMALNPELAAEICNENAGNPIFASNTQSQDILAAALADTDVFQPEQSMIPTNSLAVSQLSPGSSLYPISVNNVLETSTMSSPIMTPLEVPSTNTKKINDEVDILSQVPKNVDLPITITDPNISQTVAQQQAAILASELHSNLDLPITIPDVSVSNTDITSPYGYALPLDVSVEIPKPFRSSISMPLLTEDPDDPHVSVVKEHISVVQENISEKNEDPNETEINEPITEINDSKNDVIIEGTIESDEKINEDDIKVDAGCPIESNEVESLPTVPTTTVSNIINTSSLSAIPLKDKEEYLLTTSISTINNQMSSSLSEPPPDMFDLHLEPNFETKTTLKSSKEEEAVDFSVHNVNNGEKLGSKVETPETHSPSTNSTDDSCEIPVQPEIVTEMPSKSSELLKLDECPKVLEEDKGC